MSKTNGLSKKIGLCLVLGFLLSSGGGMGWAAKRTSKNSNLSSAKKKKAPNKKKAVLRKRPALRGKISVPKGFSAAPKTELLPRLPKHNRQSIRLGALLLYAYKHNSTLLRLRRTVHLFRQREKKAGAWSDPKVGISGTNFPLPSFNPTKTGMSGIVYSISQKFPVLRRLDLQKKLVKFDTSMMQEVVREKEVWISFQIRKALYWMGFLRRALNIEKELHQLTGQAASVARVKYTVGKGTQASYFQALTAQSMIRSRMVILIAKEQNWRHRLLRLLGTGGASLLGQANTQSALLARLTVKQVVRKAFASRGSVRRWKLAALQAKQLLSLARVRYWPDVTVQLSVRQRFANPLDQGNPFISLGFKLPIPSWGNSARHGLVREAMSRHQLARSRIRELRTQFREQARITLTLSKQYLQQIQIAERHTIPLATRTYRSSMSHYQVDKTDFLTLLSNLRVLFKEKLKLDRLRTKRAVVLARLHAISGFGSSK